MRRLVIPIALLTAVLLFVGSGVCLVAPGEVVVVRRLGRLLDPAWGPGLHWRYPFGIDRVDRVLALEVRQFTIGLSGPASADFEPSAGEFMTGDLNLLRVQATVQYRAANPADYVLRAEQLEPLLTRLAEAALTRAMASRGVDGVLRSQRQAVAQEVAHNLQSTSAAYQLGVAILGVNLTDTRPPLEVEAAFAAAQSAESRREERINEARTYAETTATTARCRPGRFSRLPMPPPSGEPSPRLLKPSVSASCSPRPSAPAASRSAGSTSNRFRPCSAASRERSYCRRAIRWI